MADIATGDDQSTYKAVEDAFFGILWTLQTQRKTPLVNLNILSTLGGMLLDFCHMLAFFVHGFGWGSITVTWGLYVRYIQLQLPLYHYEGFAYAFWAAVGITVFISLNAIVVGHSFWTKNFNQLWAIKMLHFVVAVFFNFVFIASFYLLVTPWFCDPTTQVLIPFAENGQDIGCFTWPNILSVCAGTISIIILVFLVFTSTLASVEYEPVANDLNAVSSPSYRMVYNGCLIFMTIDEYFISKVIPVVGHWWEALFNLILVSVCFATVFYYLPYQLQLGNELRGGMLGLLWWTAACSFVVVNMSSNHDGVNRVIDYVLLAGLIPAAIAGALVIKQRYIVMKAFAVGLADQIDPNFTPEEIQKARFGTRKQDYIPGADRNPNVYLPNSLQIFSTNLTTIEIIGRLIWFETDDKRYHEAAFKFYRFAELAYPDVAYARLLRATCLSTLSDDPSLVKSQFDMIPTLNPSFSVRFALYKREMEAKQKGSSSSNSKSGDNDDSLDLVAYVEFQKYYLEAQRYNAAAVDAIREFWTLFLQPEITFAAFNSAARTIEAQTAKALATYKTLLIRYPKHVAILTSYGYFLDLVMHNAEEAMKYHRRADEIRSREAETNKTTSLEGNAADAAVISITEDGTIESVNKILCVMFGYSRQELISRSIKSIVPSPWKERHDLYMDKYKATGDAKAVGMGPRKLYGQHKLGYSFAITLTIQERRKENGDKTFVAMLVQTDADKKEGVVMIREDGTIVLVTKVVTEMFGFTAPELLRTNVTILMIDAYAANHESYLRRYKETGEARVIGTAGRNVPARRKDGSVFPASLTVEEEYVGYEKFFLANIQDTTSLKAIIYMDGFGTIQNVDIGITQLLGYRKDDVIGRNIKGIMPPPYNQYHDMYLERYRRTKISNILRSVDGRVLPALHADGSTVQIKAIVTRADSNDGGSNMLFKGVIQRMDSVSNNSIRKGFRNEDFIEISKDGIIRDISRTVLKLLGYNEDFPLKTLLGQSIELIIPPVESRPTQSKEYWIPKCLSMPEFNFYILCVNKNYSLTPFTVCCFLRSADSIIVRLKDVSQLDALITIDESGVILAFNEDAFLLLGHEPDEAIGQNIKFMLVKEIADQHDFFLQRYRDTRVARVVGVARTLNTIHRDQSVFPIEIQVTELKTQDGISFIGRIRHLPIEDRVSKEIMDKLTIVVQEDDNQILEEGSHASLAKSAASHESSQHSKSEKEESVSTSDSESEDDEAVDHQAIDAKLKYIKESEAEDHSSVALAAALKYSMILYALIYIVALIVFNVLPNPANYMTLTDQLIEISSIMGDAVAAARQLQLQQQSGSLGIGYNCSWNSSSVTPKPCAFASENNVTADLLHADSEMNQLSNWFTNSYLKFRTAGDEVDSVYSSPHGYYDFVAANPNIPVYQVASNWAEFTNAKLRSYLKTLAGNNDLSNPASKIAWNFIIYNREIFYQSTFEIIDRVPSKIQSMLNLELIVHLIFTLILLFAGAVIFLFVLWPRLKSIHSDRMLILKLVLLVPRAVIWEFVYVMYRASSDEDNEDDETATNADGKSRIGTATLDAKILRKKTDEVTEIVPDKSYTTFLIFTLGLFSLALPAIAHCAWRFSENSNFAIELDHYLETAELFTGLYAMRWRQQDIWATNCPDMTFCHSFAEAKANLSAVTRDLMFSLDSIQHSFAGDDEFSEILYRISNIDPLTKAAFCPSAKPKTRCNDTYEGEDLPKDFSLKTSRGSSLYFRHVLESANVLSQTVSPAAVSEEVFWLPWESLPLEGNAKLKELTLTQEGAIRDQYASALSASSATYGISLAYALFLFMYVFGTIRANLQNESKHNRSILFMIPNEVVKKNKQILDYVDRVFLDLSG